MKTFLLLALFASTVHAYEPARGLPPTSGATMNLTYDVTSQGVTLAYETIHRGALRRYPVLAGTTILLNALHILLGHNGDNDHGQWSGDQVLFVTCAGVNTRRETTRGDASVRLRITHVDACWFRLEGKNRLFYIHPELNSTNEIRRSALERLAPGIEFFEE